MLGSLAAAVKRTIPLATIAGHAVANEITLVRIAPLKVKTTTS